MGPIEELEEASQTIISEIRSGRVYPGSSNCSELPPWFTGFVNNACRLSLQMPEDQRYGQSCDNGLELNRNLYARCGLQINF